jgi:cytochrome b subunit of formate dehydrogenase
MALRPRWARGRAVPAAVSSSLVVLVLTGISLAVGSGPAAAEVDAACLECHSDPELRRETSYKTGTSVFVDALLLKKTVHADLACTDCHQGATGDHPQQLPTASCSDCHGDAAQEYGTSLHGKALQAGDKDAPTCADCHGVHDIRPKTDPQSTINPKMLAHTCAGCHADAKFIARRPVSLGSPLKGYEQSVHFQVLQADKKGASCVDCHESHALRQPSDPRSSIYRSNIPTTCGHCHAEIRAVYDESIHGRALAHGSTDAPTCVDCHGEHEIRGPGDPRSNVYPAYLSQTTCVWCHESQRIVDRYGLSPQRLSTYANSYHGLANRGGSKVAASCASCHGIHDIRPSTDPKSSISPANLARTCGKCHPGAGESFALGSIHVDPGQEKADNEVVYYARFFYLVLILGTVAAMAVHNGLDLRTRFRVSRFPAGGEYIRFTRSERVQHAVMALSFIALAYSGFVLKFPETWWATPFTWFQAGEDGRRLAHRAAAVAMVAICLYHLGYLALTRRGRAQFTAMRPGLQDLRDLGHMLRHYLGREAHPPAFARFSYMEKLEYWALVWGSAVMTLTGFALWFENQFLRFSPRWGLDLATVVHYYEAWLAVLSIVIWHFYWVIFNPSVYPMSLVWWNGRMSEEAMAEEHPLELAELRDRPVSPPRDQA